LEETIQSVLAQEYDNLEYIVMDGGSDDGSKEIIKKYSPKLAYWASEKDRGQGDAISRGLSKGTGEIMGWVNADDILIPGALGTLSNLLLENPWAAFATGASVLIDERSSILRGSFGWPIIYGTAGSITHWRFQCRGATFLQPGTLWRRRQYEEVGGLRTEFRFCMDVDLFWRLSQRANAIATRTVVAGYRIHALSKTSLLQGVRVDEEKLIRTRYGFDSIPRFKRLAGRIMAVARNRYDHCVNAIYARGIALH
jgi:glycosyltransferase involved in cell wall biosynthesis